MAPALAFHDVPNVLSCDAVPLCQSVLTDATRAVLGSNSPDLLSGEFVLAILFALMVARVGAALADLIPHVVESCTQEEVVWSNAGRSIAGVQYVIAVGNRAIGELIDEAMGTQGVALVANRPIALLTAGALPDPAGAGRINACPQAFSERPSLRRMLASARAVFAFPFPGHARMHLKANPAVLTDPMDPHLGQECSRQVRARNATEALGLSIKGEARPLHRKDSAAVFTRALVGDILIPHPLILSVGAMPTAVPAARRPLILLEIIPRIPGAGRLARDWGGEKVLLCANGILAADTDGTVREITARGLDDLVTFWKSDGSLVLYGA